jgi:hypothetical protein
MEIKQYQPKKLTIFEDEGIEKNHRNILRDISPR